MKYAIIENEVFALQNLKNMVEEVRPDYELVFTAESAEECVDYFSSSPQIDLIFMDIELTDSNCFHIFEQVEVSTPIIFTTAYDNYAIKAFKVNSVDYLLKPISEAELKKAIEKFENSRGGSIPDYAQLLTSRLSKGNRQRILISMGDKYSYVNISDVAYFIREEKYVNAILFDGKSRITDFQNLSEVMAEVSHTEFFFISRNVVTNIEAISNVSKWFNGRLHVTVGRNNFERTIVVSSSRKKDFLEWLGGKL